MNKLIVLLFTFSLLISCKSKESSKIDQPNANTKDEYKSIDSEDPKTTDYQDPKDLDEKAGEWPQSERRSFISSCIREAMKGGQTRELSQNYCDCMLEKIENEYPDIKVAATLSETEINDVMSKYVKKCLDE